MQRAVVLAAGRGSRLVGEQELPKPLKPVAGVPLLVRILRTLQSQGIREAVVVVGDRGEHIRRALTAEPSILLKLRFVENLDFHKKNGVSLLAARRYIDRECLLTMADHLYSPEIVRRLQTFELPSGSCALGVDHDIERCFDIDDATKVKLDGLAIASIAKELESYDAIDTGVFRIGPALIEELERVYEAQGDCSLSDGVYALARRGRFLGCSVGEARWIDVDTPEAAARAEAMLRVFGDELGDEPEAGRLDADAVELFAPTWVRAAKPYDEDHFALAERQVGLARMMSNESPFAPSERVLSAIVDAALGGNRYPAKASELRRRLGELAGFDAEHVLLGAGSAELIDLVVRTFVAPGEEVLLSVPTFSMYEARTRVVGGIPVLVPMTEDAGFDVPSLIAAITERTKVVFLCTPNNPTGNRIDDADLRRILRLGLPTVIDEAYVEFAVDGETQAALLAEFPNALILRTFSKAYGLAGLRVGYVLAHPAQIRLLTRVKVPWNLSSVAIAAAIAALDDIPEQSRRLEALRDGGEYLVSELTRIPRLQVTPCEANFVLLDTAGTGLTAESVVEQMLSRGIFLRSLRSHRGGRSLVRITIGDEAQNRRCVTGLREIFLPLEQSAIQ
ncbi:MAG: histidinol-phosphate transaminase [Deltaproteobacteria bacterium]|nr:histidinol-phosphate transaminase [Deltaproteobacteria bacterium]